MGSPIPYDRVMETTTTTGTGTLSLGGAVTGYRSFVSAVGSGNPCYYVLAGGGDWEVGIGTVTSGTPNTLSRDTVLASSNGGSVVSLAAVSHTVALDFPASLADIDPRMNGGRVTLTSGTPVTTGDVTAATTLYFTPYKGNRIALPVGSGWKVFQFSEMSVSPSLSASKNYDVFLYWNGSSPVLTVGPWTNDTTRTVSLTSVDGVLVASVAGLTARYLGTVRTTASSQFEDSYARRFVWNYYNRVPRPLKKLTATSSWTYGTAAWRSANADNAMRVEVVLGQAEDPVCVNVQVECGVNGSAGSVGIGLDSTSAVSAQVWGRFTCPTALQGSITATYEDFPSAGYHFYQWIEYADTGTASFLGTPASGGQTQSGITGRVFG